jgi:putative redox protein
MTTDQEELAPEMAGYKEKINPIDRATLDWERDLTFVGRTPQGYEIEFDANVQMGCKPTDALLLSLAGCMGIDVVSILRKMRVELTSFQIALVGERNPVPPQYYRKIDLELRIAGASLDPKRVDRAMRLSREKYCSVFNTLRSDIEVTVRCVLDEKAG